MKPVVQDQVAQALALQRDAGEIGATAADAREKATVFMAAQLADRNRRNEIVAVQSIMKTCTHPAFAWEALYRFERKNRKTGEKTVIKGPSVNLARELARCWGNMRTGIDIVSIQGDEVTIRGWAWDIERNNFHSTEDSFKRLVQRTDWKTKEVRWVETDEREFRELVNRRGAVCERNAILKLMPPHVVGAAEEACEATVANAANAEAAKAKSAKASDKQEWAETIANILRFFAPFGVDRARLEARFKCKLEEIGGPELADLRQMKSALKDGTASPDELFPRDEFTDPQQPAAEPSAAAGATPTEEPYDPFA